MREGDVAVFFDFENIFYSVRNIYGFNPDFRVIMDDCERHGRVILARAYADWMQPELRQLPNALYANGVEPIYVPTYHRPDNGTPDGGSRHTVKNSVDLHLCIDVMKSLFNLRTLETFILLTGDRDFIPLVNVLKQHGKRVVVIGVQGSTSAHLAQAADEFIYYHDLIEGDEKASHHPEEEPEEVPSVSSAQPVASAVQPPLPSIADLPVEPPRMGVEVVSRQEQGGVVRYSLRDLRSRHVARGVVREEAHGLWLYAIEQYEQGLPREHEVKWIGDIGLWRSAWRMGRGRYDLVQRESSGRLHVYYGVTDDGMTGPWAQFIKCDYQASAATSEPDRFCEPPAGTEPLPPAPDKHLWSSLTQEQG